MGLILDLSDIDLLAFIGEQESQEIRSADTFGDDLAKYVAAGDVMKGSRLPWDKLSECIRAQRGQLSVWAGVNASGKSLLLGQVIMGFIRQNQTACIASLEMKPVQTLYRMARQSATCHPSIIYAKEWASSLEDRLYIYDQLDSLASEKILGLAHYCAKELAIDHLVIDSLTKCGLSRDDYAAQAKFVDRLQWAAKDFGIHIHLVCHMRKASDEYHKSGKFDIRGAAEISDLADNVFIIERHKLKEEAADKQEKNIPLTQKEETCLTQPDNFLSIAKNREYGIEKRFGLWYHDDSGCFLSSEGAKPIPFEFNDLPKTTWAN
jgi:twinkle protein